MIALQVSDNGDGFSVTTDNPSPHHGLSSINEQVTFLNGHYFNPEVMREESEDRKRVSHKLKLCPEQYLPIVEGAIDGALKIKQPNEEMEGE